MTAMLSSWSITSGIWSKHRYKSGEQQIPVRDWQERVSQRQGYKSMVWEGEQRVSILTTYLTALTKASKRRVVSEYLSSWKESRGSWNSSKLIPPKHAKTEQDW